MDKKQPRKRKKISWTQRMSQNPDFFDQFKVNRGKGGHTWVQKGNKRRRNPEDDYPEE